MGPDLLAKIKLVIADVDGVLTDGSLYYGENGEVLKRFNVHDGLGVRLLQQIGVEVAIVSGRASPSLERRAQDLGIRNLRVSVSDKGEAARDILQSTGIAPEDAAFIGDDIIDFLGFDACGCAVTVADAPLYVRNKADIVLSRSGGHGALRELADMIVMAKGHEDLLYAGRAFEPTDGGSRQ